MFSALPDSVWKNRYTLPAIIILAFAFVYFITQGNRQCENICETKGYAGYRYVPRDVNTDRPESCTCLTLEETRIENRIPKGTAVPMQ